MKPLYYILICGILVVVGCDKEEISPIPVDNTVALTGVELAIANGEPMASIIANYPVSSLYGVSYQGGLIFYVDSVNATGLVALQDVNNDDPLMSWWHIQGVPLNGLGNSLWAGQNNTDNIVNFQGSGDYAAYYCDTLNFAGYSDWFMPSLDDLSEMYIRVGHQSNANFQPDTYMSSSQGSLLVNTSPATYQYHNSGVNFDQGSYTTFNFYDHFNNFYQSPPLLTRPVRQFN